MRPRADPSKQPSDPPRPDPQDMDALRACGTESGSPSEQGQRIPTGKAVAGEDLSLTSTVMVGYICTPPCSIHVRSSKRQGASRTYDASTTQGQVLTSLRPAADSYFTRAS